MNEPVLTGDGKVYFRGKTATLIKCDARVLRHYFINFGEVVTLAEMKKQLDFQGRKTHPSRMIINAVWRSRSALESVGLEMVGVTRGRALVARGERPLGCSRESHVPQTKHLSPEEVKAWRCDRGWNITQASRALGISHSWMHAIENGTKDRRGKPATASVALTLAMKYLEEKAND